MTFHFRQPWRDIVVLSGGEQSNGNAETELGSSEYAKEVLEEIWGTPPALDLAKEKALQKCLRELIEAGDLESAHDCSEGGLAVALAESSFISGVGVEVELGSQSSALEALLFGEAATRVVISCDPTKTENIKHLAVKWGLSADRIGRTVPEKLSIKVNGSMAVAAAVSELKQVWESALKLALHAETAEHLVPEILQKS